MSTYKVLVTGLAYVEVDASNAKQAKELARGQLAELRFGIWDMNIQFDCEEEDLIEKEAA
jgi:hypothetical protein